MGAGASAAEHSPRTAAVHRERRGSTLLHHPGTNDLIINNLESRTGFNKNEIKTLQNKFMELAEKQGNSNTITEEEFREALGSVGIIESDQFILHQLFNVMDKQKAKQINFKDFITCSSILVASDSLKDKLHFTFQLYCGEGKKEVSMEDMKEILTHLNSAASWFGSPAINPDDIEKLIAEVFEKHDLEKTGNLSYSEYMHAVAENPVLVQFLRESGKKNIDVDIKLPVWWVDIDVALVGEASSKYADIIGSETLKAMIKASRDNSMCKSVIICEEDGGEGGKSGFQIRQEWHGPFNKALVDESEFVTKTLTELGEGNFKVEVRTRKNVHM